MQAWGSQIPVPDFLLSGKVVRGFGRGSKQLGVPTANLEMTDENKEKTKSLIPGVYSAIATLKG
jgi:riboflavin kinase